MKTASKTYHASNGSFGPDKQNGITLREHYAGLAMQGMLANPHIRSGLKESELALPVLAIAIADGLCKELDKPT